MNASNEEMLSHDERRLLLRIARESLENQTLGGPRTEVESYGLTVMMRRSCGAFVTLHKQGRLRGCIGYTRSQTSMAQAVADNAVNAGFRDPRFNPVVPDELRDIAIEISVLLPGVEEGSPFIPVDDVNEIVIGRDGLYLECGGGRGAGLLLPQVPVEQGWNLEEYLRGICMKAGVSANAWRSPTSKLYRFRAEVFSEEQQTAE